MPIGTTILNREKGRKNLVEEIKMELMAELINQVERVADSLLEQNNSIGNIATSLENGIKTFRQAPR